MMWMTRPLALMASILAGCASYGPGSLAPGVSREKTVAAMGQPTACYALPQGGERLEFKRGPGGYDTFMLDFDAQGRLVSSQQVLNERHFNSLRKGTTREEVLAEFGHPSDIRTIGWQQRRLWSYRYDSPHCLWFQVSLDTADRVVDTGYANDPRCDVREIKD